MITVSAPRWKTSLSSSPTKNIKKLSLDIRQD
jgi:hypothetical protein